MSPNFTTQILRMWFYLRLPRATYFHSTGLGIAGPGSCSCRHRRGPPALPLHDVVVPRSGLVAFTYIFCNRPSLHFLSSIKPPPHNLASTKSINLHPTLHLTTQQLFKSINNSKWTAPRQLCTTSCEWTFSLLLCFTASLPGTPSTIELIVSSQCESRAPRYDRAREGGPCHHP